MAVLPAARVSDGPGRAGTVWYAVGPKTAVAPILVHGNGQGKRLFRILSCKVGLFCKWRDGGGSKEKKKGIDVIAHEL